LKALGGSFNSLAAACAYNFIAPNEKYKVRVSAMGFRTDKNNLTGNNADNNWTDLIDNYENDYSFGMKFNSAGFSAGFTYSQKQSSNATAQKSVGSIYRDFGSLWNIRFINSYLAYRESFTKNISGSAMVYNRNATVLPNSVYYVTDTAQVGYYRPNNLVGAEMMLNYNGERYLNINSGLSVEYERLSQGASLSYSNSMYQKPPEPSVPIINGNVIFSAFLEPRLTVSNQLFVTGGARIDINKDFKYVLTPRVGLNYSLGKQLFRVFYAEAFRAPKPWDYTDGLGNSNLKPEKFRSYELSGTFIVAKGFSTQMSVYYNELFNGMMRVFEDDGFRWVNQSIIRTKGVELSFNYLYHKWKFYTNYTYNKSFNEQGLQVHEISPNVFNAGTTYRMNKNLKINLRANYVGERTNPKTITAKGNNLIDAYLLLSGAITWIPSDQVSVQLLAKNLLDAKYYHSSNRQPDRYLQPGRGVFLTMAYNLNK
ncbi:MAG: TonB-dependent receptor, partial [Prolixibacteraceae bacterium]|nr:TonB-dependent receptor [Prolixibacteraceae bacterium]